MNRKEYQREWAKRNPEKVKAKRDKYYAKWYPVAKQELSQKRKEDYKNNKELRDKALARAKVYAAANKEAKKLYHTKWRKENKGKWKAVAAKRTSAEIQRCPSWLTTDQREIIECLYDIAACYTEVTGVQYQVDHSIPLQGKLVSGLHVPDNLHVLTFKANREKSNKFLVG